MLVTSHLFLVATFAAYDGGPHDCVLVDPGIYTRGTCQETHISPTKYDWNNLKRYILPPVPGNTVALEGGRERVGNSGGNMSGNFHGERGRGLPRTGGRSGV